MDRFDPEYKMRYPNESGGLLRLLKAALAIVVLISIIVVLGQYLGK